MPDAPNHIIQQLNTAQRYVRASNAARNSWWLFVGTVLAATLALILDTESPNRFWFVILALGALVLNQALYGVRWTFLRQLDHAFAAELDDLAKGYYERAPYIPLEQQRRIRLDIFARDLLRQQFAFSCLRDQDNRLRSEQNHPSAT